MNAAPAARTREDPARTGSTGFLRPQEAHLPRRAHASGSSITEPREQPIILSVGLQRDGRAEPGPDHGFIRGRIAPEALAPVMIKHAETKLDQLMPCFANSTRLRTRGIR